MQVVVGSKAPPKVDAVRELLLEEYASSFPDVQVIGMPIPSGVSEQPMSLEETVQGAHNRAMGAKRAVPGCAYGIGIEDGFIPFPGSRTGWCMVSVSAFYDGQQFYQGMSSGFESPIIVMEKVLQGLDLSEAWEAAGLHNGQKLGYLNGSIGILTKGRVDRKEYTKQGLRVALLEIENRHFY